MYPSSCTSLVHKWGHPMVEVDCRFPISDLWSLFTQLHEVYLSETFVILLITGNQHKQSFYCDMEYSKQCMDTNKTSPVTMLSILMQRKPAQFNIKLTHYAERSNIVSIRLFRLIFLFLIPGRVGICQIFKKKKKILEKTGKNMPRFCSFFACMSMTKKKFAPKTDNVLHVAY